MSPSDDGIWLTLWTCEARREGTLASLRGLLARLEAVGRRCRMLERGEGDHALRLLQVWSSERALEPALRALAAAVKPADGSYWEDKVGFLIWRHLPEVCVWRGPGELLDAATAPLAGLGFSTAYPSSGRRDVGVTWREVERARLALLGERPGADVDRWLTPYGNGEMMQPWPLRDELEAVGAGLAHRGLRTRVVPASATGEPIVLLQVESADEDLEEFIVRLRAAMAGIDEAWAEDVRSWAWRLIPMVIVHAAASGECRALYDRLLAAEPRLHVSFSDVGRSGWIYASLTDGEDVLAWIDGHPGDLR